MLAKLLTFGNLRRIFLSLYLGNQKVWPRIKSGLRLNKRVSHGHGSFVPGAGSPADAHSPWWD